MHTVIETPAYLTSVRDEGLTEDQCAAIVAAHALNPELGELIPGTGGARKVRFAGRGKGKSGGYRVITFFGDEDIPVFLLDVYGKDTANLSKAERNELKKILTSLPHIYREQMKHRVRKLRRQR